MCSILLLLVSLPFYTLSTGKSLPSTIIESTVPPFEPTVTVTQTPLETTITTDSDFSTTTTSPTPTTLSTTNYTFTSNKNDLNKTSENLNGEEQIANVHHHWPYNYVPVEPADSANSPPFALLNSDRTHEMTPVNDYYQPDNGDPSNQEGFEVDEEPIQTDYNGRPIVEEDRIRGSRQDGTSSLDPIALQNGNGALNQVDLQREQAQLESVRKRQEDTSPNLRDYDYDDGAGDDDENETEDEYENEDGNGNDEIPPNRSISHHYPPQGISNQYDYGKDGNVDDDNRIIDHEGNNFFTGSKSSIDYDEKVPTYPGARRKSRIGTNQLTDSPIDSSKPPSQHFVNNINNNHKPPKTINNLSREDPMPQSTIYDSSVIQYSEYADDDKSNPETLNFNGNTVTDQKGLGQTVAGADPLKGDTGSSGVINSNPTASPYKSTVKKHQILLVNQTKRSRDPFLRG